MENHTENVKNIENEINDLNIKYSSKYIDLLDTYKYYIISYVIIIILLAFWKPKIIMNTINTKQKNGAIVTSYKLSGSKFIKAWLILSIISTFLICYRYKIFYYFKSKLQKNI